MTQPVQFPARQQRGLAKLAKLSLDFTINNTLDPRITFSRTSNATLVGPDGLIQYAPHNLLTYSEQFDNAAWVKGAAVTITANMSGTTVSSVSSFHVYTVTGRTTLTATAAVDSGAGAGVSTRSTITTPPVYGFAVHQWGGLTVPTTPTWSSTIGTPTITGVGTASTTYVSVTDTTSANGGVSVTTTFTSVNNTSCRMNSVSFSYI